MEHEWSDVSRHGSPMYVCDFCDVNKWDVDDGKIGAECPKAREYMEKRAYWIVHEMEVDYRKLLEREAYEAYLRRTFGR